MAWAAVLTVGAVLWLAWATDDREPLDTAALCTLSGSGLALTPEQVDNARIIAEVAAGRGLPDRAAVIAVATAMQESRLRNLDHGDRDSLGLFQQRPSQGWGTPAQVQDPVYAAGIFYDRLLEVGGWDTRPLGEAAHAVQRSAFPELVPRWEPMAVELTTLLQQDASGDAPCP